MIRWMHSVTLQQPSAYLNSKIMVFLFLTMIFLVIAYHSNRQFSLTLDSSGNLSALGTVDIKSKMRYMSMNPDNLTFEPSWSTSIKSLNGSLAPCMPSTGNSNSSINVSMEVLPMEVLKKKYNYLSQGGHNVPKHCKAVNKIAVIIPYRDRASHLHILLNNLHPFLTDQYLDYSIFVVEQTANQIFNRGKLLNVGFVEAMKLYNWDCVLLHDVDLLPEDRRNLHVCPSKNPRHMAVAIDKFQYRLFYEGMFGTSCMLSVAQFEKVNGLSNRFWGWGGEDDDLYTRVVAAGYKVERYNTSIARYKMIKHKKEPKSNPVNPCRYELLKNTQHDWKTDGLNNLRYRLLNITFTPLYTHILVDLLEFREKSEIDNRFCSKNST